MIFGEGKPESEKHLIRDYKHVTIFPVAIPSIASPGAIMAVVLLTDNHLYTFTQQSVTTLLVALVIIITMFILLAANIIQKELANMGFPSSARLWGLSWLLMQYKVSWLD